MKAFKRAAAAALIAVMAVVVAAGAAGAKEPKPVKAPKPAKVDTVIFEQAGQGSASTESFVVPARWEIRWSYDCSHGPLAELDMPGNFIVAIKGISAEDGANLDFENQMINKMGKGEQGTSVYHSGGRKFLEVNSTCDWNVQAVAKKRPAA